MTAAEGRVALITGGGTGVGRATVLRLAARGYHVAINYSRSADDAESTAREARALGVDALTIPCNVARDDEVRQMAEQCREQWGRLDVVVNNAATTHFVPLDDLESVTEGIWNEILDVNVKGAFFVSRAMIPLLRESGGGAIVNVASVAGLTGSGSSLPYSASKGALVTMSKSLAKAFAPEIRVNAVCPGVILSRWLRDHQEMIDNAVAVTPLKRASTPEDVAEAIVFLACDASMITGEAIVVDGGRTRL
jgi:3-oxoacyl-[acyl-carrier protein] reductase